jgi:hypothetical protein
LGFGGLMGDTLRIISSNFDAGGFGCDFVMLQN